MKTMEFFFSPKVTATIISQMFILFQFQQYENNVNMDRAALTNASEQTYFS